MAIPLNLSAPDGKQGVARLVWPLAKPLLTIDSAVEAEPETESAPAPQSIPQPEPLPKHAQSNSRPARELPNYSKSLLKIKVPVIVTLAEQKQPLGEIVEMGPGMIIQFEKSCEETLQLEVGECKIASGEAIKVGDKFGIRITSIVLPEERFYPIKPQKQLHG